MARSTAMQLPERVCLLCGLRMEKARVYDGDGVYLPAPPVWHTPRVLGVRGQVCSQCLVAVNEPDPRRMATTFEIRAEAIIAEVNPEAHAICLAVKAKSHPDVDGQRPSPRVRLDRAELGIKGQNEFHSWRQASFAWHVRAHGDDPGKETRFGWITQGYVFPEVTRPLDQRFIDLNLLPRYPDGSPYIGPDDEREHEKWLKKLGAYAWRTLEPARLVE